MSTDSRQHDGGGKGGRDGRQRSSKPHRDVVILGAGFAGSILARMLNARGFRVALIEKGSHPRFAIGESTTPLGNLSLERIAARYRLPDLHSMAAYGRWLRDLPHLRRGLKRGFTFFSHRQGQPWTNGQENEARLMVAASPEDSLADSHWLRSDVDHHLVTRAAEEGVDYRDHTEVDGLSIGDHGVEVQLRSSSGSRSDTSSLRADWLVDGTGTIGLVAKELNIGLQPRKLDTGLLFGHFSGVKPFAEAAALAGGGTKSLCLGDGPYPEEAAAVHHLTELGWLYALGFDHGVTSAGFVLRNGPSASSNLSFVDNPARSWRRLLRRFPTLQAQFSEAEAIQPLRYVPRISYQRQRAAGPRWFLLPHTFAFFDPLFSTGIAWSLIAVERIANLLEGDRTRWAEYEGLLVDEAAHIKSLIECAYLAMPDLARFRAISLLYFAAASFAEVRCRLFPDSTETSAWQSFLGARDELLTTLLSEVRTRLQEEPDLDSRSFESWILRRLRSRDIVGLDQPPAPNLYPVDFAPLIQRSHLVGLDQQQMIEALPRLRGE